MKILSPWSLELPECQTHRMIEYSETSYLLLFDCGLVMTTKFWRLLGDRAKKYTLELHKNHHQKAHNVTTANGVYGVYKTPPPKRASFASSYTVACGVGCSSFSDSNRANMVSRSDLLMPVIANVKDDFTSYDIALTATNEFVCTCNPRNQGKDSCAHIISLLSGRQKNIMGVSLQMRPISKRKIRFDR